MKLAIPVAGAVIGWFAGGGPAGARWGWMIGSAISMYVDQPDAVEGPRADDLGFSGSSFGLPVGRGWGTFPMAGSYIWAPNISESEVDGGGGCGGDISGGPVGYEYFGSFAVIFCEGPVTGIRRIWFDTELVFDASEDNEGHYVKTGLNLNIYTGTTTQTADPVIEAVEGVGNVSGHRGYCYITVDTLALANYGNKLPSSVRAEIVKVDVFEFPEIDLVSDVGNADYLWSHSDNILLVISAGIIRRVNTDTNTVISTSIFTDVSLAESATDVDPISGMVYGYKFSADGNHTYMVMIEPITGKVTNGDEYTNTYCNAPEMFTAPDAIIVLKSWVASCNGVAGADNLILWPFSLSCEKAKVISTAAAVQWAMDDSSGNIWYSMPSLDIVNISETDYDFSTLLGITGAYRMQWHVPSQSMLVDDGSQIYRVSYDLTASPVLVIEAGPISGTLFIADAKRWTSADTIFLRRGSNQIDEVNVDDLTLVRAITIANMSDGLLYDPLSHAIWRGHISSGKTSKVLLDRLPDAGQALSTVVSEIASDLGDRINVSDLNQTVRGFIATRPEQNREMIRRLMIAHKFDGTEVDGEETFIELDGAVAVSIPEVDLAAHQYGAQTPPQTEISRVQEIDFPKRAEVIALSQALEYEPISQGAGRQISKSTGSLKINLLEVLTDDEVAQLAEILLHVPRAERNLHTNKTGNKYLYLHPIDQVNITKGTTTHRVRLTEIDWSGGLMGNTAVSVDVDLYTSTKTGAGSDGFIPTDIGVLQVTLPYLMDAPLLSPVDDPNQPGFYAAYTSDSSSWPGASLYKTPGLTSSDAAVISAGSNEATAGYTTTALADVTDTVVWDTVSTVNVRLNNGTLSSSTDAAVVAGANALFIIGSGELIQFVNVAVANSPDDGEYTLSRLLRGRRGTEWATGSNTAGQYFSLLTIPTVYDVPTSITTSGVQAYYRAVTFGLALTNSQPKAFTNNNVRLKPWSGVNPEATATASEVVITWTRRTRVFIEPEFKTVPLGEASEAYEIDIRETDTTTVLRTITATSETFTYTFTQMVADFGVQVSAFDVDIYQMSEAIGRGYPLTFNSAGLVTLPVYTDFSEYTVGSAPFDWTTIVTGSANTFVVEAGAGVGSAQVDSHTGLIGTHRWDSAGQSSDTDVLVKGFYEETTSFEGITNGISTRITGVYDDPTLGTTMKHYVADIYEDKPRLQTSIWTGVAAVTLADISGSGSPFATLGLTSGDPYWMRLRVIGDSVKAKYWTTSAASEPGGVGVDAGWTYDVTDTAISGTGYAFMLHSRHGGGWHFETDQVAVAYNGNTAEFP